MTTVSSRVRAGALDGLSGVVERFPVTAGTVTVLALGTLASDGLTGFMGMPVRRTLAAGVHRPVWTWLTSWVVSGGPVTTGALLLAAASIVGVAERRIGGCWTLGGLFAGQLLGVALGLGLIAETSAQTIWGPQLSAGVVLGPLPGLLAVLALATARMSALWRCRMRMMLSVSLAALVLYSGTTAHVTQLSGWLVGLAGGALLRRSGHPVSAARPTRREGRALVALVVAMTALGPLVVVLSQVPGGPLAVLSHLFIASRPQPGLLRSVCGPGGDPFQCSALRAQSRVSGPGATMLSVLPVVLQLVLAEGLRKGRRAAWLAAVLLTAALALVAGVIAVILVRRPSEMALLLHLRPGTHPAASVITPLFVPVVILVVLLSTHRLFRVRAAPGTGRRWLLTGGAALTAVSLTYVVAGWLMRRDFSRVPSAGALLLDLPQRMLPPGYLGEFLPPLLPLHHARMLCDWAGVAAWTVLLATAIRVVRPGAPTGDAMWARYLVRGFGDGPLSYMTTWAGNHYWFTPDHRAMVAYRVYAGVALTTGDPVGDLGARTQAVRGFADWCADHGWVPCWYGVTDDVSTVVAGTGIGRVQVAVDTWLPLGELTFTGRQWQDVRTAVNRAGREGIRAEWITWSQAPLPLREQIVQLSEEWLAAKGLPEMSFTLGGLDELADDEVRCVLAVDGKGQVQGLTSWLPAYRCGAPVGWTLDVMRRRSDASPGTMEFLIATAAVTFQNEGAEWVSLSGAPLALPPEGDRRALTRLLELAGLAMEPVYGFRSLLAFKAKFQPRYRPLWLLYPEAADLLRIARAVSQAYVPRLSLVQAARLVRAVLLGHRAPSRPRRAERIEGRHASQAVMPPAADDEPHLVGVEREGSVGGRTALGTPVASAPSR